MKRIGSRGLLFFTNFILAIYAQSDPPLPLGNIADIKECKTVAEQFSGLKMGYTSSVPETKIHGTLVVTTHGVFLAAVS